jgi:hypothetical protein
MSPHTRHATRRGKQMERPEMTGYILFHGDIVKADSLNLDWVRREAKPFHARFSRELDVFVLPHAA